MNKLLRGRRRLLKAGLAGFVGAMPVWGCATRPSGSEKLIGFSSVPISSADAVAVPPGYSAQVLSRWGDPLGVSIGAPEFRMDASNSAAEQALQAGMHHDGIELFPLLGGNALLAVNYEYTDDGLLHPDGMNTWNGDKVR